MFRYNPDEKQIRRLVRPVVPTAPKAEQRQAPTTTGLQWLRNAKPDVYTNSEYRAELPASWLKQRGIVGKRGAAYIVERSHPVTDLPDPDFTLYRSSKEQETMYSKGLQSFYAELYIVIEGVEPMGFIDDPAGQGRGKRPYTNVGLLAHGRKHLELPDLALVARLVLDRVSKKDLTGDPETRRHLGM